MKTKTNKGIWCYQTERKHTKGAGEEKTLFATGNKMARKANLVLLTTELEDKDTEMALKT